MILHRLACLVLIVVAAICLSPAASVGQAPAVPSARLIPAAPYTIPSLTDSNTPMVWERIQGQLRLFAFASESGETTRLEGSELSRLLQRGPVRHAGHPGHGVWLESIVPDVDGTWYGYYHHESPAEVCGEVQRTIPRIGAARSNDFGATWEDLGIVLEAPRGSHDCGSVNDFFLGGVGDFSAALDHEQRYLYIFFSQYASRESVQGVSVARLAWADRDAPSGKAAVWWRNQTWLPTLTIRTGDAVRYVYPAGGPIYRVTESWHAGATVDAFWGPSVHWNTYLQRWVMLLNHAQDSSWTQEGVYITYTADLSDPGTWSMPQRLLAGGTWYPQVVGTEPGAGTDRQAGEYARFYVGGRSNYVIQFSK